MAIEDIDIQRTRNEFLFNVTVRDTDGSAVSFRWNKNTGMEGLKASYQAAKAPSEDTELADLKVQALAELNK